MKLWPMAGAFIMLMKKEILCYPDDMNAYTPQPASVWISLVPDGTPLQLEGNLLASKSGDIVRVSSPGLTARLSMEDFFELYGTLAAIPARESTQIDEEKDEEYYAWRREKQ